MANVGMMASHTSASLEDFEHHEPPASGRLSPVLRYPRERSGFLRDSTLDDHQHPPEDTLTNAHDAYSSSSAGEHRSWSPHGWRGPSAIAGSGWYRHQPYIRESSASASPSRGGSGMSMGAGSRSREPSRRLKSEGIDDEDDLTLPANIPLPRGSMSPDKEAASKSPVRDRATQSPGKGGVGAGAAEAEAEAEGNEASAGGIGNCEFLSHAVHAIHVLTSNRYPLCIPRRSPASHRANRISCVAGAAAP
jgi:hypothetical protein